MMWYKDRRTLMIVIVITLLLGVWNMYNIMALRSVRAEERALATETKALSDRICEDQAGLDPGLLYIDTAIQRQAEHLARLERELGVWFRTSLFTLPADFLPAAQQSPKVFFN
jgi:hypothetical protein